MSIARLAIAGGKPVRPTMLPYARQSVGPDDTQAVVAALTADYLTTGPAVSLFEEKFAAHVGATHAVAVSSGTAALHAAYHAARLGPGDEVIIPALTFAATANAALYCGATPVFVDVEPDTLTLSPEAVAAALTPRTRAIVAVDYAGHPCNYDALQAIAERSGVRLLADACHAVGATWKERRAGTLASMSAFSLHPAKHLTTGEGGMVTTEDAALAARMRTFRNHGITTEHRDRERAGGYAYDMTELGFNYRLTDVQCALGLSQLKKVDEWVARRRTLAALYMELLAELPSFRLPVVRQGANPSWHLFVVRLHPGALEADRDTVFAAMRAENIGVNVHYRPVYLHPYYRERFRTAPGLCPVAETAYAEMLTLPLFPAMGEADVRDVVRALGKVHTEWHK